VITFAGEPDAVANAALRIVGKAADIIDLTQQSGVHPRIGAVDVLPFVPLAGHTLQDCVELAHRVGPEIWKRYAIPIYFYEAAALRPERKNLENIRKGQCEALREEILRNPDRAPDIGDRKLHPTAGAIAVGARRFLIAFNVLLNTCDLGIAKQIAQVIRASSGGLPYVKAIGLTLATRGLTQVSINLTDFERTPIQLVFAMVADEARRRDCKVVGSELVGLIPQKALENTSPEYLQIENFSLSMVLENRLAEVIGAAPGDPRR
jgi:glutamate formiminotransferase